MIEPVGVSDRGGRAAAEDSVTQTGVEAEASVGDTGEDDAARTGMDVGEVRATAAEQVSTEGVPEAEQEEHGNDQEAEATDRTTGETNAINVCAASVEETTDVAGASEATVGRAETEASDPGPDQTAGAASPDETGASVGPETEAGAEAGVADPSTNQATGATTPSETDATNTEAAEPEAAVDVVEAVDPEAGACVSEAAAAGPNETVAAGTASVTAEITSAGTDQARAGLNEVDVSGAGSGGTHPDPNQTPGAAGPNETGAAVMDQAERVSPIEDGDCTECAAVVESSDGESASAADEGSTRSDEEAEESDSDRSGNDESDAEGSDESDSASTLAGFSSHREPVPTVLQQCSSADVPRPYVPRKMKPKNKMTSEELYKAHVQGILHSPPPDKEHRPSMDMASALAPIKNFLKEDRPMEEWKRARNMFADTQDVEYRDSINRRVVLGHAYRRFKSKPVGNDLASAVQDVFGKSQRTLECYAQLYNLVMEEGYDLLVWSGIAPDILRRCHPWILEDFRAHPETARLWRSEN